MVEFAPAWYQRLLEKSNEKDLLARKIADLAEGKPWQSCLEIGPGASPYFAEKLAGRFKDYALLEKRAIQDQLPRGIRLITADWEEVQLNEKFDVIIASHILYYFRNKNLAVKKIMTSLGKGGMAIFVVNGRDADYGPLKLAFARMAGMPYVFTHDKLLNILRNEKVPLKEISLPSTIRFDSPEELFETLRIFFDAYPEKYETLREEMIEHFRKSLKGNFTINQKIILARKN